MRTDHSATGYLVFAQGLSGSQVMSARARSQTFVLTALRLIVNLMVLAVLPIDLWKPMSAKQAGLGSR
jgi:hypothetical protein